jgi:tetratricopeptide (TPR) repeat protein
LNTAPPIPPAASAARIWLYRALAVFGLPALLCLGLEGGLRLAGFGRSAHFLIPDDQPGYFRTNPDFVSLFLPGNFDLRPLNFRVAQRKPANTVRVVLLGESAAQGIPAPAFGFAPQLRAQLRARYPGKDIEVINTGIVAINSHVVYQIARDLADFSPDLFVVYLGNNEVVGPYGPGCAYLSEMPPLPIIRLSVFVRSTRTGQLLATVLGKLARHGPPPADWGGMSMFADSAVTGDDPRLEAVYRNFATNLADIVHVATDAGAKTLLCTVVSNLKDCAPLLSRHRTGLAEPELAAWRQAFNRGLLEWRLAERAAALADLEQARMIDPHYADTLFLLGSLKLQAGEIEAARTLLLEAEHWDALRFRPDPRINEIIRRVAGDSAGVKLLDAAVLLGSDAKSIVPPAGRELLFEHVHFDWEGNYQLARALAQESEAALFGATPGPGSWLDSPACAAAVGYSAHERYAVLRRLDVIVVSPPFTNQLTYVEDQARLARDLARAQAASVAPENLQQAKQLIQAAIGQDPENPTLAKLEEDVADALDDVPGALAAARRSQQFQPGNFALAADEAIKLSRLGRFDEAERLLKKTAATCPPRDLAIMAPAFADFFYRTKRLDEGRRYLDGLVALRPADRSLPLLRGRLADLAGDTKSAEQEFRAILAAAPDNAPALEALLSLLKQQGQTAAADQASLAAAEHQPKNQENNLRAALIAEAQKDEASAVRFLLAAERSGPVTAAFEMHLARKFFDQKQVDEALTHLALAKKISSSEGKPEVTDSITQIIAKLRVQAP